MFSSCCNIFFIACIKCYFFSLSLLCCGCNGCFYLRLVSRWIELLFLKNGRTTELEIDCWRFSACDYTMAGGHFWVFQFLFEIFLSLFRLIDPCRDFTRFIHSNVAVWHFIWEVNWFRREWFRHLRPTGNLLLLCNFFVTLFSLDERCEAVVSNIFSRKHQLWGVKMTRYSGKFNWCGVLVTERELRGSRFSI